MTTPHPAQSYLSGVSCIAVNSCWAVGNPGQPFIEQLAGKKWKADGGAGGLLGFLDGISCGPSACSAVGTEYDTHGEYGTVTEQDNRPGAWFVSSTNPASPNNGLTGVSCTTATDCIAVGYYQYDVLPGPTLETEPLLESWDGSEWSGLTAPSMGTQSSLSGVACAGLSDCMAVGTTNYPSPNQGSGLIEHWNGSTWTIVTSPATSSLTAISCVASADCTAVGLGASIEHWDGTTWAPMQSVIPSGSSAADFSAISCTSASNCMAAGSYVKSSSQFNLTEHWDGTQWSIVASPNR